jgi:hypothetical protein
MQEQTIVREAELLLTLLAPGAGRNSEVKGENPVDAESTMQISPCIRSESSNYSVYKKIITN